MRGFFKESQPSNIESKDFLELFGNDALWFLVRIISTNFEAANKKDPLNSND